MKKYLKHSAIAIMLSTSFSAHATDFRCPSQLVIESANRLADTMVEQAKARQDRNHLRSEMVKLQSINLVFASLEARRASHSPSAVTDEVYDAHSQRAFELELIGFQGKQSTNRLQVIRMLKGHPRFRALMAAEARRWAVQNEEQGEIDAASSFYHSFVNNTVDAALGNNESWLQKLNAVSRLSLVLMRADYDVQKFSAQEFESLLESHFAGVLTRAGTAGFAVRENSIPNAYKVASSAYLTSFFPGSLDGWELNISELPIDSADVSSRIVLAMTQRLDFQLNRSDRWDPMRAIDPQLLATFNPGSQPISRPVMLDFFSSEVAARWTPPAGIQIHSRLGSTLTARIERGFQATALDNDPRIRSFR